MEKALERSSAPPACLQLTTVAAKDDRDERVKRGREREGGRE